MAYVNCSIDDCGRPVDSRGMCEMHYQRWRNSQLAKRECSVAGCSFPVKARGLCNRHYLEGLAAGRSCLVSGCPRPPRLRGFCSTHYYRWWKHGDPGEAELRRKPTRPCKVEGCKNTAVTSRDLCATHAQRKRLYGTESGMFVTHKKCVVCGEPAMHGPQSSDHCPEHYLEVLLDAHLRGDHPGVRDPHGYVHLSVRKRRYDVHRLVMERQIGRKLFPFESPHHKNGIRHDNSPANLELWTKPQPAGQRPEDLVAWVLEFYPDLVAAQQPPN